MTILSYKYTFWSQNRLNHKKKAVLPILGTNLLHNDRKGRNIPRIVQLYKTSAIGKVMTTLHFELDR